MKSSALASAVAASRFVYGSPADFAHSERVALLAEYGDGPNTSPWALRYAGALADNGYQVLLVAARNDPAAFVAPRQLPAGVCVLLRPNVGYDFGSWATALRRLPAVAHCRYVLLTNDSIVGPFADIAPMLASFEQCKADVWAATANTQLAPHVQSFLLGFRQGILADKPIAKFFANIREQAEKMDYVKAYEIGLSALLRSEGYSTYVQWLSGDGSWERSNPSLSAWQELLQAGFPFAKKMLLDDAAKRAEVIREVHSRYGIDIQETV